MAQPHKSYVCTAVKRFNSTVRKQAPSLLASFLPARAKRAALSQGQVCLRIESRDRRKIFARRGTDFVAGAASSQCQVQISWQAQHFRKVKRRFRGRRCTFAMSSTNSVAGVVTCDFAASAAHSQGQGQISWQAQHFRDVKCRFRGRCSTFASLSTDRQTIR